jgi:hypothetical protein
MGIFTQDAASWKHSLDMLRPLFSFNRANTFTQVEEHTKRLVKCIPTDEFVDLQPLFFQFTFDTTTFLLFGKSMNSLQATSAQDTIIAREADFTETFSKSQHVLFRRARLGNLYWMIGGKEFRKHYSVCITLSTKRYKKRSRLNIRMASLQMCIVSWTLLSKRLEIPWCCVISC